MNIHTNQNRENTAKSVSAASPQAESVGESTFQFVDNRPEALAQRKLQEMANNSPRVKQVVQQQAMLHNSAQLEADSESVSQMKFITNLKKNEHAAVQRKVYSPPKPTGISDPEIEEWNSTLEQWTAQLTEEEDWIQAQEVEMWNVAFNYANTLAALKLKIKNKILSEKIPESDADGIDWGDITGVIGRIKGKGTCTVNISVNVPYDGGIGTTWYVKGNASEANQRGGWKNNAMEQRYLPNARSQVKTALRIHNDEIDTLAATV